MSTIVNFRCDNVELAKLKRCARAMGQTVSEFLRDFVKSLDPEDLELMIAQEKYGSAPTMPAAPTGEGFGPASIASFPNLDDPAERAKLYALPPRQNQEKLDEIKRMMEENEARVAKLFAPGGNLHVETLPAMPWQKP